MENFIKDLTYCYNNDGTMMFSYSNSVITIFDEINFSEDTSSISDVENGDVQILCEDKSIWISPDKLLYDPDDEMYSFSDNNNHVNIGFVV